MAGISVPSDRTCSQRAAGFCRNPKCCDKATGEFHFVVENDKFSCPKCGADAAPMVGLLVLIHLLIPVKNGPILGSGGITYQLGCDDKRAYMATHSNQEACTGEVEHANCPGCLAEAEKRGISKAVGWGFKLKGQL